MEYTDNCPFCGTKAKRASIPPLAVFTVEVHFYDCGYCGKFIIKGNCENLNKDMTAAYLYHRKKTTFDNTADPINIRFMFLGTEEQYETYMKKHRPEMGAVVFVTKEEIESWWPKTFKDRIDKILLALYRSMNYDGETIGIRNKEALFICRSNRQTPSSREREISNQIEFVKNYLHKNELATSHTSPPKPEIDELFEKIVMQTDWIMLLPKGLEKIYEIDKQGKKQCFVAMWFPDERDEEEYNSMCLVAQAIYKAIEDNGFEAMRIDKKEHNNQIVPEILFEIKNSRFMVADFTGHRSGVYYEAGIMEGLGRDVIACCTEADFEERHFDIAQKNIIKYKTTDTDELYKRLSARIRATIEGAEVKK